MASIKVKFRPSTVADREGAIYYQIIHERKVRQLPTDYKVFQSEWDESRSMVVAAHDSGRKQQLLSIRERIRWDVERLTRIDRRLKAGGMAYTADDVIDGFNRYAQEYSLFNFMESLTVGVGRASPTGPPSTVSGNSLRTRRLMTITTRMGI